MNEVPSFLINSAHKAFVDRQNTLFKELDKVLPSAPPSKRIATDDFPPSKRSRPSSEVQQFKGRESIFKRPEAPISKCLPLRNAPDFKVNPHKWKKYTLNDVRDEDISERGNRAAALSFLKQLREARECEARNSAAATADSSKIRFSKTSSDKDGDDCPERKYTFKSSKVLMPEYVVGQKIKKTKSRERRSDCATNQLVLNHLLEEGADEDVDI